MTFKDFDSKFENLPFHNRSVIEQILPEFTDYARSQTLGDLQFNWLLRQLQNFTDLFPFNDLTELEEDVVFEAKERFSGYRVCSGFVIYDAFLEKYHPNIGDVIIPFEVVEHGDPVCFYRKSVLYRLLDYTDFHSIDEWISEVPT